MATIKSAEPRKPSGEQSPVSAKQKNEDAVIKRAGLSFDQKKRVRVTSSDAEIVLLSEEASLYVKKVIFRAFIAWLTASKDYSACGQALALETARLLGEAEQKSFFRGNLLKVGKQYRPLVTEIYIPIGGMRAIAQAIKSAAVFASKNKASIAIRYVVGIAHIWDYHSRELKSLPGQYAGRALKHAAPLAHLCAPDSPDKDAPKLKPRSFGQIRNEYWKQHQKAISYLFAADCVLVGSKTLLHMLLAEELTYQKAKDALPRWFAIARYFRESVHSKKVTGKTTECPPLNETARASGEQIRAAFDKKATSERRSV